jgi:hypothetical protein
MDLSLDEMAAPLVARALAEGKHAAFVVVAEKFAALLPKSLRAGELDAALKTIAASTLATSARKLTTRQVALNADDYVALLPAELQPGDAAAVVVDGVNGDASETALAALAQAVAVTSKKADWALVPDDQKFIRGRPGSASSRNGNQTSAVDADDEGEFEWVDGANLAPLPVGGASALLTFFCVLCTLRTHISRWICNFTPYRCRRVH